MKAAHEELQQLIRQRTEIMKRIGTVRQTILGLASIFGEGAVDGGLLELLDHRSSKRQSGFTNACRVVLMESTRPLSAREFCEHIQRRNPPLLLRHKDPLASVTTVLNRLVEYGEANSEVGENGRRAWSWACELSQKAVAPFTRSGV
ncbi:MAG: hypothetical protein NVS1B11_22210 [Terriglobales bacterium]